MRLFTGLLFGFGMLLLGQDAYPAERPAWTTSRIAGSPDPQPPYVAELAFPELKFDKPVDLSPAPGSNRMFVFEQSGRMHSFVNDPATKQADLVFDLKSVIPTASSGYAFTFHPDFEQNRYVYICYLTKADSPDGTFVSRFEMSRTDPPTIDVSTEKVIIRWWCGGHNGCSLKFGPDGYLYISTGDGGPADPPDPLRAGQDLSNLLSSILRIDVDQTDVDRNYRVPADNPFVGMANVRPEIWAYGFRNPWRMSFDRQNGDLWVGDVGWQLWEMVYRIEKGGNYGWAITEGPQPVLPELPIGPTPILPPTVAHPHSEAASITGGYVYHGDRLPELQGVYIYGDFQTGKIWGLTHDGHEMTSLRELANTPIAIVGFGEDHSGEIYILDYEGAQQIHRLIPNPRAGEQADFPRQLSLTGLFSSASDQVPASGVIPYFINAPQWADHTASERWLAAPGTEPIRIDEKGNWQVPEGTVLAKTVSIEMEHGSPQSARRLETQILHREEGSWRPYSYRWNAEQTDAELIAASGAEELLSIRDPSAPGGIREQRYRYAARAECQLCHNPWVEARTTIYGVQTASPLALTTSQLNRIVPNAVGAPNQLTCLQQQGWLAGAVPQPEEAQRYVDPKDSTAALNERVRSYWHVNCSHCHQIHAGGTATIDLSFDADLDKARLLDVRPSQGAFGISDARLVASGDPLGSVILYRMAKTGSGRMPRLGSELVDESAVAMIADWIAQLPPPAEGASDPHQTNAQHEADLGALKSPTAEDRLAAINRLTSTTRGALALVRRLDAVDLPPEVHEQVVATAARHQQAEVRDLFERYIPLQLRVQRLGESVDVAQLLAIPGDVERGRELFFRDGAASCKSCHRLEGTGIELGPDLSQIGKKYARHEMLTHILEPSRLIDPKYVPYVLETTAGQVVSGLLVEKTDAEVKLRDARNEEQCFRTDEVELLVPQQKSLMPDLLLRDLTSQQVADLLAFLCSLKSEKDNTQAVNE